MAIFGNTLDCDSSKKGTGLSDCIQELGKPIGFIDLSTSWSANTTTDTFNQAYFTNLLLEGTFIPFGDSVDFADNTEDDVFQTFTSGDKRLVRDGKPEFDFIYTKGYHWHAAAYSHNSNQNGAVAFVWDNGVIGFAITGQGTIAGLKRGYLKTKTFQNNDGSNVSLSKFSFQLRDAKEYNTSMYLINEDNLGASLDDVMKGAIDTRLAVTAAVATGATTFSVNVTAAGNQGLPILGLLPANFQVSGQIVAGAVYNATTKEYDITIDAATAGSKVISLGNGSNEIAVDLSGTIYSGSGEFTVA